MTTPSSDRPSNVQVTVRYQGAESRFGSQFIVNAGDEELLVDVSDGLVLDSQGRPELPVHTRLALSWAGARRLTQLLQQALRAHENGRASAAPPKPKFLSTEARLPSFEVTDAE